MIKNYQDAIAICRWIGYPLLFITFTCNLKLYGIEHYLDKHGLWPEDCPNIFVVYSE